MDNNTHLQTEDSSTLGAIGQIIGRFIVAAIILGVTAFFTPGFSINNIWALALATIFLAIVDYLIVKFTGLEVSAFGKGFVGFILAVITLYFTQYFVAGYSITWVSAIIGALVYGIIDYLMPSSKS